MTNLIRWSLNDIHLPVCRIITICPVVTSSVPRIDILLSWGWVTANSLWKTYNSSTGPTTWVLVEHIFEACSLKWGNCWKNEGTSLGASSRGTPLINKNPKRIKKRVLFWRFRSPIQKPTDCKWGGNWNGEAVASQHCEISYFILGSTIECTLNICISGTSLVQLLRCNLNFITSCSSVWLKNVVHY